MDTYLESDRKLLESVESSWGYHLRTNECLLEKCEDFSKDTRETMNSTKPTLPVPASKQDCLLKVREVQAGFGNDSESRQFVRT